MERQTAAIMGASIGSIGSIGTARAQYHLRQVFIFLKVHAINQPEVVIGNAAAKFDGEGTLTDEATRERIGELLQTLVKWTKRLRPKARASFGGWGEQFRTELATSEKRHAGLR